MWPAGRNCRLLQIIAGAWQGRCQPSIVDLALAAFGNGRFAFQRKPNLDKSR
jgi:hypothetical protein